MAVTEVGIRLSLQGQQQVDAGLNGAADSLGKIDDAAKKVVNSAGKLNDSLNVKGTGLAAVSDSLGKIDKAAVSAATGTTKLKDALGNISHEGDGMASLASKIGMVSPVGIYFVKPPSISVNISLRIRILANVPRIITS